MTISYHKIQNLPFYSLNEFTQLQPLSRGKSAIYLYQHKESNEIFVVKQVPFSQQKLKIYDIVIKLHGLDSMVRIRGICKMIIKYEKFKKKRSHQISQQSLYLPKHKNQYIKQQTQQKQIKSKVEQKVITDTKQQQWLLLFMQKCSQNLVQHIKNRKRQRRPFKYQQVTTFISQTLFLLQTLQKQHISHRDIKPENFLFDKGKFKLCDFDDSIYLDPQEDNKRQYNLTTVQYTSPEFFRNFRQPKSKIFDPYKLDLYALGITIIYMCSMGKFNLSQRRQYLQQNSVFHNNFMKEQRRRFLKNNDDQNDALGRLIQTRQLYNFFDENQTYHEFTLAINSYDRLISNVRQQQIRRKSKKADEYAKKTQKNKLVKHNRNTKKIVKEFAYFGVFIFCFDFYNLNLLTLFWQPTHKDVLNQIYFPLISSIQTFIQIRDDSKVIDILLSLTYMIKQEISPKKNTSTLNLNSVCVGQNEQQNQRNLLCFTEIEFVDWCMPISTKELVQHFKILYPEAVRYFRNNLFQYKEKLAFQIDDLTHINHISGKMVADIYFQFSQVLVLTSEIQYLDSISLNSEILMCPKKTYKLLANMKSASWMINKKQQISRQYEVKHQKVIKNPQIQVKKIKTLQILDRIAQKIQKNLSQKMKLNFKVKLLQKSDTLFNQFNFYWRNYSHEEKDSIWYLGFNDIKKAASKFLNRQQKIDFFKIQQYVYQAKKLSNKQINCSVFSWKLNQQSRGITQYMQLVFKQIKQRIRKRSRQYVKLKPKNKKKKKIKERLPRRDSMDESSNQTNQTDIIYQSAFDININEIIQTKIEKDIINLADDINQEANLYFDNKVLGYERLRHIFANINVSIKLYGSCCVGLAIKNSDIDVAIQQNVLNQYYPYMIDTSDKISSFFEYIQSYFANYPWISNIKIIKSASIPIIKFTIDNRIQFNSPIEYGYQVHQFLNKKILNPGLVQIDLTIQTTQSSRRHLGIISTRQTQAWLNQIPTLQAICIILKKQLAQKNLNQTYYGGINTYTLLILIIAIVRRQKLGKQTKVCVVMEKFLKFYCQQFDQQKFGIDLNLNGILYPKSSQKISSQVQLYKLTLQDKKRQLQVKDPMNSERITTRNCYQFRIIKKIFSQLHQSYFKQTRKRIQQLCSIWNPKQNPFDQEMLMDWVERQIQQKKLMRIQKIQ